MQESLLKEAYERCAGRWVALPHGTILALAGCNCINWRLTLQTKTYQQTQRCTLLPHTVKRCAALLRLNTLQFTGLLVSKTTNNIRELIFSPWNIQTPGNTEKMLSKSFTNSCWSVVCTFFLILQLVSTSLLTHDTSNTPTTWDQTTDCI